MLDCLIVGGGPAGLTAALYLARFGRSCTVIDAGDSRAARIPVSHNLPGFPEGISGEALLLRLRRQAAHVGVPIEQATVDALAIDRGGFIATIDEEHRRATSVLLATGVADRLPSGAAPSRWHAMTLDGLVRWCPICDAYEVRDRRVGLIAPAGSALGHAAFLRTYTRDLTLILAPGDGALTATDRHRLQALDVLVIEQPIAAVRNTPYAILVQFPDGAVVDFDTLYPLVGCTGRSHLATALGALCDAQGELFVDAHQSTSVAGLYAAGIWSRP
ncbi:thioredoxin reductase (NADPH) [Tahibacter aquaticus]|uniref:Thioredoxin reductase (NADPH) n=1 Tax=Tahibacter aquaticus TaxID=520092 RepID=A0A4R6YLX5_9GAMM|nr:NAD(P)/FAD-dependent oxidoreductase [Tahibacter aquaticus]TDR38335.1 thioredoxin reductase (NADPH) [Tahibacter aquaticus]